MALYSNSKWARWLEQREDRLRERYIRESRRQPKLKAVAPLPPIPEVVIPAFCEFKGCPYPVTYRFRDINADSYICLHHARLMDEEAGQFDEPLRESWYDHTRQRFSNIPICGDDDSAHWDGFHLVMGTYRQPVRSNRRYSGALSAWAERSAARRQRERDRDNKAIKLAEKSQARRERESVSVAILPEFNRRVLEAEQERARIHSEIQRHRWQVFYSGGIWVQQRQVERVEAMRSRMWRELLSENGVRV